MLSLVCQDSANSKSSVKHLKAYSTISASSIFKIIRTPCDCSYWLLDNITCRLFNVFQEVFCSCATYRMVPYQACWTLGLCAVKRSMVETFFRVDSSNIVSTWKKGVSRRRDPQLLDHNSYVVGSSCLKTGRVRWSVLSLARQWITVLWQGDECLNL